ERRGAATRERIEHDVARPRVAGDEGVREGGREARQVRAHRVERVAPQALLRLPVGFEGDRREFERQLEGELARGRRGRGTRARSVRSGRHRRVQTSLSPTSITGRRDGARSIARPNRGSDWSQLARGGRLAAGTRVMRNRADVPGSRETV